METGEAPAVQGEEIKPFDDALIEFMNETDVTEEEPITEPGEELRDSVPPTGEVPPKEPPKAVEPPPEPVAAQPTPPPPPPPPAATPQATAPEARPATPQPEAPPQWTQEQIEEYHKSIDRRLSDLYQITDDEAAALQTDPKSIVPKLGAALHKNILAALYGGIMQQLTPMIDSRLSTSTAEQKFWGSFYEKWPALRGYDQAVQDIGTIFVKQNPNAPHEEFIETVGRSVAAMYGLQPAAPPPPPPPAAPQPSPAPGFTPAGQGTRQPGKASQNQWEMLSEEILGG